jgi:hypothetical protein
LQRGGKGETMARTLKAAYQNFIVLNPDEGVLTLEIEGSLPNMYLASFGPGLLWWSMTEILVQIAGPYSSLLSPGGCYSEEKRKIGNLSFIASGDVVYFCVNL